MTRRCIGLMSGTSLDGVDGVLVVFTGDGATAMRVLAHHHVPFEAPLGAELLALNTPGENEIHRAALAGNALATVYASVCARLLRAAGLHRRDVAVIGCHGQTVRHRPGEFDGLGYTVQLNNPALLAELSGIDVAAEFRHRDVAAGGQGAPLVPAFHRQIFGRTDATVAVLNLGGIGNLTILRPDGETLGFDCGPGNGLLDHWVASQRGQPFDRDGAWAASGSIDRALLDRLLAEPFFALPPPKSTGRDLFNAAWLRRHLDGHQPIAAADVQATLAELTASVAAEAIRTHAPLAAEVLVCGGGAFNLDLMRRLQRLVAGVPVGSTSARGLPAEQVEACAFAWLADALVRRRPGNLPAVTGARGGRILGALYPGAGASAQDSAEPGAQ
jgi:anhydro-N-acetylmuramic acid kinase